MSGADPIGARPDWRHYLPASKGQWRNRVRNIHPRDGNHIARDLTVYEASLRRPLPRHRANRGLVNL
jgi:hypothetical protein